MTAAMIPPVMQDGELRAGVLPIEEALQEWDVLVERAARLHGLHGSPLVWDAKRKALCMAIRKRLRGEYLALRVQPTEARLDEEAHADDDYIVFITQTISDRATLYKTEKALEALTFRIYRGQSLLRFASAEVRMTP